MQRRVAFVDGMAKIRGMGKPEWINNCLHLDLYEHVNHRLQQKYGHMDEGRIIFDRYDLPASPKHLTRQYRQGNTVPVAYHFTDTTHITNVQMRTLLGHVNTKMQLTEYFVKRTLETALAAEHHVVVSWGSECTAT